MMNRLLWFSISLLWLISSCSRTDEIEVDNRLRDYTMSAFYLKERPADVQAFLDSLSELDSLVVEDTLELTIGDSVFLLGVFNGASENIKTFTWRVSDGDPQQVADHQVYGVSFADTGLFKATFVVTDKIGGKDSTGDDNRIKVINTAPEMSFHLDTVWSSERRDARIQFVTEDRLGSIEQIAIDWDGDGEIDTTFAPASDSLDIAVPFDSAAVDSLNNQMVVVQVSDEDGNTTADTVYVHFNEPPSITLNYPFENGRIDINSPLSFIWEGDDGDNPDSLFFTLRVSINERPSRNDNIAEWISEPAWEAIDRNGNRFLDSSLSGMLYWQVMVQDGYDTVFSEVSSFFLGDLSLTSGFLSGVAVFDSMPDHRGMRVSLEEIDEQIRYQTQTDPQGNFDFGEVEAGLYRLTVRDTLGFGWPVVSVDSIVVELGLPTVLDTLHLIDSTSPGIALLTPYEGEWLDLNPRNYTWSGVIVDSGSQVNASTLHAQWNGLDVAVNFDRGSWEVLLENIPDGHHMFTLSVSDNVGNESDTLTLPFLVDSKDIHTTVNGAAAAIVTVNDTLRVESRVLNANPPVDMFIWAGPYTPLDTTESLDDSLGYYNLVFSTPVPDGELWVMAVDDSGMTIRDTIQFVVAATDVPSVVIVQPGGDTTVTIGDELLFAVISSDADGTVDSLRWDLDGDGSFDERGTADYDSVTILFSNPGDFSVIVEVEDDDGSQSRDTVHIMVETDAPTVRLFEDQYELRINQQDSLQATAQDVMGEIVRISWSCGGEDFANGTSVHIFTAPSAGVEDWLCIVEVEDDDGQTARDTAYIATIQDPPQVQVGFEYREVSIGDSVAVSAVGYDSLGTIVAWEWRCEDGSWENSGGASYILQASLIPDSTYYCMVRVTDNDGQYARDSLILNVLLDPPTVQVFQDSQEVSINDDIQLRALALDDYGYIAQYEWSCGTAGVAGVSGWRTTSGADTVWTAPATGTSGFNYLCVIRVSDDDQVQAMDTLWVSVGTHPPVVELSVSPVVYSIYDEVTLTAVASDPLGTIVDWEWACAGDSWQSGPADSYTFTAPSAPVNPYECRVQVWDDDGQSAADTVSIEVVLDPPSATVLLDSQLVALGGDISLEAQASDGRGSIVLYEWSCGGIGVAGVENWFTVSSPNTTVSTPAQGTAGYDYLCVFRATDDDGLYAQDTAYIAIDEDEPVVTATDEARYVRAGEQAQLSGEANDELGVLVLYEWGCGDRDGELNWVQTGDATVGGPDYVFSAPDTTNLDMICVIRVTDDTDQSATDTVNIYVFQPPVASINAPESLFTWSGNIGLSTHYSEIVDFVDGMSSQPGTWGGGDIDQYEWRFVWGTETPNPGDYYAGYVGNDDGTLWDHEYVLRDSTLRESDEYINLYIKLDVHDTTLPANPDGIVLTRHVSITYDSILFYRAWQTQGDAPLNSGGQVSQLDLDVNAQDEPILSYVEGDAVQARRFDGNTWSLIGSENVSDDGSESAVANIGDSVIVAYRKSSGDLSVKFSYQDGAWQDLGSSISSCRKPVLRYQETAGLWLACQNSESGVSVFQWENSWQQAGAVNAGSGGDAVNSFDMNISPDGTLLATGWIDQGNRSSVRVRNISAGSWNSTRDDTDGSNRSYTSVAVGNDGSVYQSSVQGYPPEVEVRKYSGGGWSQMGSTELGAYGVNSTHTSLVIDESGNLTFAFELGFNWTAHYVSVWTYKAGASDWILEGEDLLPWFDKPQRTTGNYVRSYQPRVALHSSGRPYVAFRIAENNSGTTYNGCMVMKQRLPGE
jgi:hypothetical protein